MFQVRSNEGLDYEVDVWERKWVRKIIKISGIVLANNGR